MNEVEKGLLASPKLPTIPVVAQRLLELLAREASFEEIAEAIAADPGLTTQILRTVNSAAYGLPREITSLQEAVVVLGANSVRSIALSFAFVRGLRDPQGARDLDAHWRASLMTALAARGLTRILGVWDREEAFLVGMIADVGALVLFDQLEEYRPLFSRFVSGGGDLAELERHEPGLGTDHAELGGALLRSWGFPPQICDLVKRHHEAGDSDDGLSTPMDRKALNAAWVCARTLSLPGYGHETPELARWLTDYLDVPAEPIAGLLEALPGELREVAGAFEIPADEQRSYQDLLICANEQLREMALRSEQRFQELSASDTGRSGFADLRASLTLNREPRTGLLSRQDLDAVLVAYLPRARQRRCPLGLLAIEIHEAALGREGEKLDPDELVRPLLDRISRYVRDEDEVARLAPARIGLLLLDCEGADLLRVAQRIHGAIHSLGLEHRRGPAEVRVALGGADVIPSRRRTSPQQLIDAATAALDASYESGEVRLAR